jgi:hypothetical protein
MNREELSALRDALSLALALPDSVRALFAQWLTPETPKPNGRNPHPPVLTPTPQAVKARFIANPAKVRAAERRLLATLRDNPGASVNALAKAVAASRSTMANGCDSLPPVERSRRTEPADGS